ncbi:MAG: ATP-binding protein [Endomicrobia bacterium]|nr:ATP-binding protein [Endomicrobiia bacterium]
MNVMALIFFIFAIFTALVAFLVLSRRSKSAVNITFSFLCLSLTLWFFSFGNMFISSSPDYALLWAKTGFIGIAFASILLLRFIYAYSKTIVNEKLFIFFYCAAFAAAALNFYTDFFYKGTVVHFFGNYPKAGILYALIPLQLIVSIVLAMRNLKENLRKPDLTAFRHQQIRSIRNALILFAFVLIDHFLTFFYLPLYPAGALCAVIFTAVIIFSLGRYTFADVKIIVSRAFIFFFIIAAAIALSYFVWNNTQVWIVSAVFTFILAVAGTYIYRAAIDKTAELFLAEQKQYHNTLIQAASGMAREHKLDRLLKLISLIVIKAVKVGNVAIFIENESGKLFECRHIRPSVSEEMVFPYSLMHPFVVFMKNRKKPFVTADLPLFITNSIDMPFKPDMVVPFFFDEGASGFIVLGAKKGKTPFNREDIRVFNTLSRQTSLAIENCIFFEQFKETQEKIFAAEKLASVGGLADGVAHQINNRLNQFSMIAGELKYELEDFQNNNKELIEPNDKLKKIFEYITGLSDSLTQNIRRTDSVIKGILNYARVEKKGDMFSEFSLKEVFDLAMELLNLKHKLHKDFEIRFHFKNGDKIYGIRSQIIECVYNVLDNGYEAIIDRMESLDDEEKQKFKPLIKVDLKYYEDKAVFAIQDNGMGIKEENKVKIFAPFFTTKSSYKSGTGIGLYIVKRMIEENHNGKLSFESRYGHGTKIIFELPKGK